jgi:hypothetical protein
MGYIVQFQENLRITVHLPIVQYVLLDTLTIFQLRDNSSTKSHIRYAEKTRVSFWTWQKLSNVFVGIKAFYERLILRNEEERKREKNSMKKIKGENGEQGTRKKYRYYKYNKWEEKGNNKRGILK